MPPEPTPQWYDERPEWDNTGVNIYTYGEAPDTPVVSIGDGEFFARKLGNFSASKAGSRSAIAIFVPCDANWSPLIGSAFVEQIDSMNPVRKAGNPPITDYSDYSASGCEFAWNFSDNWSTLSRAVIALFFDGVYAGRIWYADESPNLSVYNPTLPLYAYREEEAVQPISIENGVAGWQIYSPYTPTRIVGYNLPTSLKYTADSVENDFTADGGDYGIEFTTPEGATRIAIFDETFWLYMR